MLLVKFDKKLVSSWGSSWLPSSWWQCWWFNVSLFLCSLPPPSSPLSFSRHCPCFDVAFRGSFANFWKWTLMYCICCIFNWIFQVWGLNFKLKHEVFKKISQIKIYAYINIPDIHDMNKRVHKKLFISSFAAVGDQLLALIFRGITFERDAWQVLLRLDHPIVWITLICPGIISESALLNYFAAQLLQDMERERSAFLCKHYHIQI